MAEFDIQDAQLVRSDMRLRAAVYRGIYRDIDHYLEAHAGSPLRPELSELRKKAAENEHLCLLVGEWALTLIWR
jgi:hypothetical protein